MCSKQRVPFPIPVYLSLTVALVLALALGGCNLPVAPGGAPAPGDAQSGGGRSATEDAQVGGGQSALSGAGTAADAGSAAEAEAFPLVDLPLIRLGGSVQRANITFTLVAIRSDKGRTRLEYLVDGLPEDYHPAPGMGEPVIVLRGEAQVRTLDSGGGGSPASETAVFTYPELPAGTQALVLLIPNAWTGTSETWRIPVSLEK